VQTPATIIIRRLRRAAALVFSLAAFAAHAGPPDDPHYNGVGFFDIRVCNWPDQPLLFMLLFSTTRFDDIARIEVARPDGRPLGALDLNRYRVVKKDGAPEKRVFMTNVPAPAGAADGWYTARITLQNGERHEARDYVMVHTMAQAAGLQPPDGAEAVPVPAELAWSPVPGAAHYQVFIKDLWEDGKIILSSQLVTQPRLTLPAGLIGPDGSYAWFVHARDVNNHVLLGDFNHGSLSREAKFSTAASK
jgi:hypothetical protein